MRGQYFSFDVLLATLVFILVFTYFLVQWNNLFVKQESFLPDAYRISSLLLSTNPYFGILFDEESRTIDDYLLKHPSALRGKIYNLISGTPYNVKVSVNGTVYWNGCVGRERITFVRVGLLDGHPVPVEISVCPES